MLQLSLTGNRYYKCEKQTLEGHSHGDGGDHSHENSETEEIVDPNYHETQKQRT